MESNEQMYLPKTFENIELVIKMSEENYKNIVEQVDKRDYPDMQIGRAIADGIVLPKYHGDLIDRNDLFDSLAKDNLEAYSKHQVWLHCSIYNKDAPTIIPESHSRVEIRMTTGK